MMDSSAFSPLPDEGTKFLIELPTAVRQGLRSKGSPHLLAEDESMSRNILIIDDEASIRQSLSGALKDEGYKTTSAASGREGLDLVRADKFDAVMLDIWMPEMDGMEVLKQIKIGVSRADRHHDVRSRQYRDRREGREERSLRFRREAALAGARARASAERGRACRISRAKTQRFASRFKKTARWSAKARR